MSWLESFIAGLALTIALVHLIDVLMVIIEGRSPLVDLIDAILQWDRDRQRRWSDEGRN